MANKIFELVGSIMVDSTSADKSLQKTDKKASSVGSTLAKGISTAGKWGAALVGACSTAVAGLTALTNSTAEHGDEIDKQSQKMQMSTDEYQKLAYAAELCGTNMSTMQTAQKKLLSAGIDIPLTDALKQCAEAEDVASAATEMFGAKTAQELLPMLNQGAEGIDSMMQSAEDLGLVMSEDSVKASAEYQDTLTTMQKTLEALKNQLGSKLMPIVTKAMQFVIDHMPQISSLIDKLSPTIEAFMDTALPLLTDVCESILPLALDLIQAILPPLAEVCSSILPILTNLISSIAPILIEIVSKALPFLVSLISKLLPILEPLLKLLEPILNLVNLLLTPLLDLLDIILTPLLDLLALVSDWLSGAIKTYIEWLAKILPPLFEMLNAGIKTAMYWVKKAAKVVGDFFSNIWSKVTTFFNNVVGKIKELPNKVKEFFGQIPTKVQEIGKKIKDKFSNIFNGVKEVFKVPFNWIIQKINAMLEGINGIKIPDWVPLVGGSSFNIPLIPELAQGGVLEKGQTGFLEGNGAEAVVPLENNSKWISKVADDMSASIGGKETLSLLSAILDSLQDIAESGIYLDSNALVGGIANKMDEKLGQIAMRKARA